MTGTAHWWHLHEPDRATPVAVRCMDIVLALNARFATDIGPLMAPGA